MPTQLKTTPPLSFTCEHCSVDYPMGDMVDVITSNGSVLGFCPVCAASQGSRCNCGRVALNSDMAPVSRGGDRCPRCIDLYYVVCDSCHNTVQRGWMRVGGDYNLCSRCYTKAYNFPFGTPTFDPQYAEIGSRRCYGIELETTCCEGYIDALRQHLAWGAKEDCTIEGKEFYSAILHGDDGLLYIREWGSIAASKGWTADGSTGFHLHLDMRTETNNSMYAIAHAYRATEAVWFSFVELERHDTTYCHNILWNCADLRAFKASRRGLARFSDGCDRDDWLNLVAYRKHGTYEIRLHHGTCDGEAVVNWVKAHTRFADWASELGYKGVRDALKGLSNDEKFALIKEVWDDPDITAYYSERARFLDHGYLTEGGL